MQYKIRNTLIPVPYGLVEPGFEKILFSTLDDYEAGKPLDGSLLISSQLNKWHKDCCYPDGNGKWVPYEGEELLKRLLTRQYEFIKMYDGFKTYGYNETTDPVLIYFDDEGRIHLYDGYHRLLIMKYLGLKANVVCETEWSGIDGSVGKDFPLADVLLKEHPFGKWLYQPVDDERVKDWKLARNDTPQRLKHVAGNIVGKRVLDVGCSEGYFSRELAKLGYDVTAIDHEAGFVSAARYLSTLEGLNIDYHHVEDWKEFVEKNGPYDTILFLCVIHNDMKIIGVEEGLKKLEVFKGKAQRVLLEAPQEKGEKEWMAPGFPRFNFHEEESIHKIEAAVGLNATEMWSLYPGSRPIFTYGNGVPSPIPTKDVELVQDVNGCSMLVFKDEPIITPWIKQTRIWEPELTNYLKKNLKAGQTFVDIGANMGYYTLLASKLVGDKGKVYAFEPASDSFELLLKNIELNGCTNVVPVQKAVSSHTGQAKLYGYGVADDAGRRGLTKVQDRDKEWLARNPAGRESTWSLVDTVRLDEVIAGDGVPDFIKVDVEGGELDTLEGMKEILMQGKTTLVLEDENEKNAEWINKELGLALDVNVKETTSGLQHFVYKKDVVPWWDLEKWLPDYRDQYWPLFNTLRQKPCQKIMEIGVHNGKNAVAMIKAAAQKVPEEDIHYYGFDLFEERTKEIGEQEYTPISIIDFKDVKAFIKQNTKAQVTLYKGNTRETLPKQAMAKEKTLMDLIYIDGGHSTETTRSDWKYSQRFMHKDTVVYFDDYNDEMPFLGSHFIVGELDGKFIPEVMINTNYYKRPFGRLKAQLLRVTVRKPIAKLKTDHFRFHLISLPHSSTVKNWGPCAFTQLTYRFSQMMHDMGHDVFHYGTEGADVTCTEHIDVLTKEVQKQAYGDWDPWTQLWIHNGKDLAYTTFRKNAIKELNRRKEPGDILLISNGNWLREISDVAGEGIVTIEPYVGYLGFYAKYKVFPSYAWMHHMYGVSFGIKEGRKTPDMPKENFVTGNWYDAVIQHFFDPADHTFEEKKDDYFLYTGRLIQRKGIHIAVDLCQRLGAKLIVCGQPIYPSPPDKYEWSLKSVGILDEDGQPKPNIEYRGAVSFEEIDKLRGKARAVIIPSLYMEPFGMVVPEALLSGTPVISTDWGAFPEIVPHGEVGYRCRTMDDFIWAANNVDRIDPAHCREYAVKNFSMERIGPAYHEYFTKIHNLFGDGWYTEQPDRKELDWLMRY